MLMFIIIVAVNTSALAAPASKRVQPAHPCGKIGIAKGK